jgi:hypothetical protein
MKIFLNSLLFTLLTTAVATTGFAQDETSKQDSTKVVVANDTMLIGNFKIIKTNGEQKKDLVSIIGNFDYEAIKIGYEQQKELSNQTIQTSWFAFDLGLTGYMDYTKYAKIVDFSKPAIGLPLNYKKAQPKNNSTNVNIWMVQQKVNLYKHKWYVKYALGLEMFNFYYANAIDVRNNEKGYFTLSSNTYKKNKLLINYITIPVQISRTFQVKKFQPISLSGGLSVGYLLNARNKQIGDAGKKKYDGDFNFSDYRVASIFQLGIGDIKFYASAALTNTIDNTSSLQSMYPYTFGIRFSKF